MTSSLPWKNAFDFLIHPNEFGVDADIVVAVSDHLKVKKNITYIVCGVIFRKVNDIIEVLMMQEVRPDCNGAWYLPAGRLEPNETLEVTYKSLYLFGLHDVFEKHCKEGMKREVLEETGIECKNEGMLAVETAQTSSWFRFTFLASNFGGELKTVADNESLGAAWYPVDIVLNKRIHLRGSDILKLIKLGVERFEVQNKKLAVSLDRPFKKLICRFFAVISSNDSTLILIRNVNGRLQLPVVEISQRVWFGASINKIRELFKSKVSVKILSTISVESYPKPAYEHDGFCLSLLCEISSDDSDLNLLNESKNSGYCFAKCDDVEVLDNIRLWSNYGCKFF